MWLGALLPYLRTISFSWSTTSDTVIYDTVYFVQRGTQVVVDTVTAQPTGFDTITVLYIIYAFGLVITSLRLVLGLRKIAQLYRSGVKEQRQGYTLVKTESFHFPFSFFKYVFLHKSFLQNENINQILNHEIKHIDDKHTWDILFIESFSILFWWNPLVYLYKNEVKQNHEFIADAYASQSSTIKNYGQILLGHSSSGIELALTHQFFNSHLKKRINMLCTTKSARYKLGKYLVLIPCLLFFGILFSSNTLLSESETDLTKELSTSAEYPEDQYSKVSSLNNKTIARELINVNFDGLSEILHDIEEGTLITVESCVNRLGKVVNAEWKNNPTSPKVSEEQKKKLLSAIYKYQYEADDTAPEEVCGMVTLDLGPLRSSITESAKDTTPIKIIKEPAIYVSERKYYKEGMSDPLIVVNGKISESKEEHFFTESKIEMVIALDVTAGQKKYGSEYKNGVLEFKTNASPPRLSMNKSTAKKQYTIQNDEEQEVFKVVDEMPRFPGCEDMGLSSKELKECSDRKMLEFIYDNLSYPEQAKQNKTEGMVVLQFAISSAGKVINSKVARAIADGCSEAAMAVIDKMAKEITWIPGKQFGKSVAVLYTLPIKFKLNDSSEITPNPENKCKGNVLLIDGVRVDIDGNYEGQVISDKMVYHSFKDGVPEKYAQYKDYCSVTEMFSKSAEQKVRSSNHTVKIFGPETSDVSSLSEDCSDAVILIDDQVYPATVEDGKITDGRLSQIKPDEILHISIYKNGAKRELPADLQDYADRCLVMVVVTKEGESLVDADFSFELPPPPPPAPPNPPAPASVSLKTQATDSEGPGITLYQNEPNPFDDNTTIGFSLKEAAQVTLTIYDVTGKVIKKVEDKYSQGYNEIELSRADFNTHGVHYYQLDSGNLTATKKMVALD
jgi:TonB family protein